MAGGASYGIVKLEIVGMQSSFLRITAWDDVPVQFSPHTFFPQYAVDDSTPDWLREGQKKFSWSAITQACQKRRLWKWWEYAHRIMPSFRILMELGAQCQPGISHGEQAKTTTNRDADAADKVNSSRLRSGLIYKWLYHIYLCVNTELLWVCRDKIHTYIIIPRKSITDLHSESLSRYVSLSYSHSNLFLIFLLQLSWNIKKLDFTTIW